MEVPDPPWYFLSSVIIPQGFSSLPSPTSEPQLFPWWEDACEDSGDTASLLYERTNVKAEFLLWRLSLLLVCVCVCVAGGVTWLVESLLSMHEALGWVNIT